MTVEKEDCLTQVYVWINSAQFVENFVKFDENGNEWGVAIYKKDDRLYAVKSLNGETTIAQDKTFYEEVKRYTKTVEKVIYCNMDGWQIAAREQDDD